MKRAGTGHKPTSSRELAYNVKNFGNSPRKFNRSVDTLIVVEKSLRDHHGSKFVSKTRAEDEVIILTIKIYKVNC